MAATYPTTPEQEQTQRTAQHPAGIPAESGVEPAVGVYERPQRGFSIAGAVLLIIVLVILAYFVMQWVF